MKKLYSSFLCLSLLSAFSIQLQAQEKGTEENPYTITEVLALNSSEFPINNVWVAGYCVGAMDNQGVGSMKLDQWQSPIGRNVVAIRTNIILAATPFVTVENEPTEADLAQIVPVQLPDNSVRAALNLIDHPEVMSGYILVYGDIDTYFLANGVRNTSDTNIEYLPTRINETTKSDYSVTIDGNNVKITASKATTYKIYLPDGKLVKSGTVDVGENTLSVSKGLYILSVDNKTVKVVL